MRSILQVCGIVLFGTIAIGLVLALVIGSNMLANKLWPNGKVYDCRLAEISPDFPIQVREGCRKLNLLEKYNGN